MLFLFTEAVLTVFPSLFVCPLILFLRVVYTNLFNSDVKFFGFQISGSHLEHKLEFFKAILILEEHRGNQNGSENLPR